MEPAEQPPLGQQLCRRAYGRQPALTVRPLAGLPAGVQAERAALGERRTSNTTEWRHDAADEWRSDVPRKITGESVRAVFGLHPICDN